LSSGKNKQECLSYSKNLLTKKGITMPVLTPSQFKAVEAAPPAEGITLIELSGELDAHTAPDFERFLEERVNDEKKAKLILDFSNLEYISSAGLGVLMGLIEEVRAQSGDMKLIKVPEKIYHVLDLLGFPIVFQVLPTLKDAVDAFSRQ
jgi:anti-sigma B factor antagonist